MMTLWLPRPFASFLLIPLLSLQIFALPVINSVQGTPAHKSTLTIQGSGFGTKTNPAPYVWDDCSGTNPLQKWDFAYPSTNLPSFRLNYRTPQQVPKANGVVGGMPLPHGGISKYLSGAHYNSGPIDASSGYNAVAGKNNQQGQIYTYISYYHTIDSAWTHVDQQQINDHQIKFYDWAAGAGYMGAGPNTHWSNKPVNQNQIEWWVTYVEGMNTVIFSVNTSLLTWYPEFGTVFSKNSFPGPKTGWRKLEWILKHNSADGFHRIYQDNKLVWEVFLDDDNLRSPVERSETVVGGYARTYGATEPYKNNWQYFADIYYDHSLARVMLANSPNYEQATTVEPQIPTAWSSQSITVTVNLGGLYDAKTAYLFVFDPQNQKNSLGFPITISTASEGPPSDNTPPASPNNLTVK